MSPMTFQYFSDRESGPRAKNVQEIDQRVWQGIKSIIETRISNGSFAQQYPHKNCEDDQDAVTGTDTDRFVAALEANIPEVTWSKDRELPSTAAILDVIEFCHKTVAEPLGTTIHSYLGHPHLLTFNDQNGQIEFRSEINLILERNGLAFSLTHQGTIERILPPVLEEALSDTVFDSGDQKLDRLLESARQKFLSPDPQVRRDSLKELWDAWERIKTLKSTGKKVGIAKLLEEASKEPKFRCVLDKEGKELTFIGNHFEIRHTETYQTTIEEQEHVDYLFHRLFSLVWLILATLD